MEKQQETIREAVGVFDDYDELYETIKELQTSGFDRRQISVLGNKMMMEKKLGQQELPIRALEDNPRAPHSPIIGVEELGVAKGVLIGGGILAGAATAMIADRGAFTGEHIVTTLVAALGGGAIGLFLAYLLERQYRQFFQRQIERGGLLLWVVTPQPEAESRAQSILRKHGAQDVHIHEIPPAAAA